ncbi:diaminopimelate decarboxylase [Labedella gwakjiensis]|uniref:Diaminopimelate decarboxylase n=1 Tax=Labedella gwakjiensis TaxID=390269 RepID=A0A2P8GYC0_9MICO|nr:diaminopimelate decarboxylase [Labedella gwakjiensis]PSL38935.1 diaminopimelate decarboxylase [Labedella gwakjiensis]RUQ86603.1 diaminopimelate decarboxylase [Labedella gwakjiensis]
MVSAQHAPAAGGPNPLAPAWLDVPADVNDLVDGVWPQEASRRDDGVVEIAGVAVTDLAASFGTPLYVVDESSARANAARISTALNDAMTSIGSSAGCYYAGKAFLSADVVRWMLEAGLGVDVCSGGELALALAAGAPPARIGFHGNNKSQTEIERAVTSGVGTIVLDSLQEIERVAAAAERHGVRQGVRLRINSGVHAQTHDFLATAHEDQKFGLTLEAAESAVAAIRSHASLDFVGLHCHIGSQIFDAGGFSESAHRLLAVHARLLEGGPVPTLNLGGGFGIAYTAADRPTPIETIAAQIAETVAATCSELGIPVPALAFEPGRSIIGGAGVTLYTVGTTKDVTVEVGVDPDLGTGAGAEGATDGAAAAVPDTEAVGSSAVRRYVSVDGGMSDNARPSLYGADYTVRVVGRASASGPQLVRLAGKHCESGDIVVNADYLPADVSPGDLVAVPATGAYCFSLASNYNFLTRPPVVAVRDGRARILVRGETEDQLLARDAGLDAR